MLLFTVGSGGLLVEGCAPVSGSFGTCDFVVGGVSFAPAAAVVAWDSILFTASLSAKICNPETKNSRKQYRFF
jgi:hypothetical protein